MSRYIDVDEVLEQIRKKLGIKSLDYLLEAERQIVDAIQSAPSIDIVFCGECKHTYGNPPIADGRSWCKKHGAFMYYCSDGEREGE